MIKCGNCGEDTNNPKYCSKRCSAIQTNKLYPKKKCKKKCVKCEKIVRNYRSSLCEEHFQEAQKNKRLFIENSTLESYHNRECLKNLHISSKNAHIRGLARSWFRELTKLSCYNCGYDKHVELCHIKAINSFDTSSLVKEINCRENIVQLCPNCHWELDNGLLELNLDNNK